MKRVKRVLALLAAFALVLAMAVPAFADEVTHQLKVNASGENHTYKVYQIFTGEMSTNEAGAKVLSSIKWGANGTRKTGDAVETGILTALESATGSDTKKLEAIKSYVNWNTDAFATLNHENSYVANVPAGYYLVKDEDNKAVKREENITNVKACQADFKELINKDILPNKILCMTKANISSKIEAVLQEKFPQLNIVRSSDILIEIMNKDVSKANGIEVLLRHLNMIPAQAIAFGDNYNDLDMLELAGVGVAMNNAPDDVKKTASAVTDDNNHDGIYKFLQKIKLVD